MNLGVNGNSVLHLYPRLVKKLKRTILITLMVSAAGLLSSLPQRWIHVLKRGDRLQEGRGFVLAPRACQRIKIMIGRQCSPTALSLQTTLQQLPGDAPYTDAAPSSFFHEPACGGVIDILNED
jgi:hypothetical protein